MKHKTGAGQAALLALAALLGSASVRAGDDAASTIKRTLRQRYPNITIDDVRPAPIAGVYEVFTGSTIVYTDRTGDHLIVGRMFETASHRDLSAERLDAYTGVDFARLPFASAIKIVRGNGARQVAIFEDPDCPYCQRLEKELSALTDVTAYVFLYPLETLHPGATAHAHAIWCSPDRGGAWTAWMLERKDPPAATPPAAPCDADPLDQIAALGKKLNVHTTPTMFLQNGHRIPGVLSLDQLRKAIDSQLGDGSTPATASR